MSKDKDLGYFEWLKAEGVVGTFENTYGHNRTQAKSVYSFSSQKEAINFKNKYLADGSAFGEVFFDQRLKKYVMPINLEAQESLKNQFQKEQPVALTLEDCQRQMDLVDQAKDKVQKFNGAELNPKLQNTRAGHSDKIADRIGNVAVMLSNQKDGGWLADASTSAIDIVLSVYFATNAHLLSPEESRTMYSTQQSILKTNDNGRFVGGLKSDANFTRYLKEQYSDENGQDTSKGQRITLIRENASLLLDGGERTIIDIQTPKKATTLKATKADADSYTQPRFLPDPLTGKSNTDSIILHAGGMNGHTAMRILKKEKDETAPGGYRYFYTKIDAGGGLERVDHNTKTGTGIYTTEITPYFKTKLLSNGELAILYDDNGNPKKMNSQEINNLKANPKEYQRHIKATLHSLISAEREAYFYDKSDKIEVFHGEPTAMKDGKFDEWKFHNNKIQGVRGVEVPERTKITPIQLTGNCTVYSTMLTVTNLAGDAIGYDVMQSAKIYNQAKVMGLLEKRKASIEQDKQNIKALSEVQNIFSLKPEQIIYQTNKTGKISFADMYEAEAFKKSLSKTQNINVTSSKSKDGTSYNIELNPQQINQIVTNAKGFKDVSLIHNLPESQNCEIVKNLDGKKQQNYIVQFADKAEAEKFSKALNERYQIKGGDGGNKFVDNHITDDGRYGVVLTVANINSLIPKLRQEETEKIISTRVARHHGVGPSQPIIPQQKPVVPLQNVEAPKKVDKAPGYEIVISEKTLENINKYKENLISGQEQPGEFLRAKLEAIGKSVTNLSTSEFIEVMLSTKQPKFFAESAIQGGGIDWNNTELRILGDINVTVPVKIFDNGVWHKTVTVHDPITNTLITKDDPNFVVHQKPLDGELLFTPGALLKSGPGFSGKTPDLDEVTKDGRIDQEAYNALVERRLLPLLVHANEKAGLEGKPALITLPGVGAGEFAGEFKGQMGQHLNIAIQAMLEKHSGNLGNIAAIHYDSFAECENEQRDYGNIKYRVRPQLQPGNKGKTQLSDPKTYQESGDDFSKCKLYKIVAWDHVSLPGNDYFEGSRYTDDGVAAAATNSMEGITGVKGRYDKETGKYLPPEGYNDWSDVADQQGVHLKVENNLKIVTDKGISVKFADYQKVVDSPSVTIPKVPTQKPVLPPQMKPKPTIPVPPIPAQPKPLPVPPIPKPLLQEPIHPISQQQAKIFLEKYGKDLKTLPQLFSSPEAGGPPGVTRYTQNIINALTAISEGQNVFLVQNTLGVSSLQSKPNIFLNTLIDSSGFTILVRKAKEVNIDLSSFANEVKTGIIITPSPEIPKPTMQPPPIPTMPPQIKPIPTLQTGVSREQAADWIKKYGKELDQLATNTTNEAHKSFAINAKLALEAIANGTKFKQFRSNAIHGYHVTHTDDPHRQIHNLANKDLNGFNMLIPQYADQALQQKLSLMNKEFMAIKMPALEIYKPAPTYSKISQQQAKLLLDKHGKELDQLTANTTNEAHSTFAINAKLALESIANGTEFKQFRSNARGYHVTLTDNPHEQLHNLVNKDSNIFDIVIPQYADQGLQNKISLMNTDIRSVHAGKAITPKIEMPELPQVPKILGPKEAIIYSAGDVETHGPRVAVKFSNQTARDQFVDNFIKEAKKEGIDLSNVFDRSHNGASDVVYIKSSQGKGSAGTYVSNPMDLDTKPELSISFGNDKVAQKFSDLLGVNKHAYQSQASGSLYFEANSLPPTPNKKSNIKVEINQQKSPEPIATNPVIDEQAKQLSEQYVKKNLVPMIDNFVASHLNGKTVTELEIKKFYTDALNKLQKDGHISTDNVKDFIKPSIGGHSKFDQAVSATIQTINNKEPLPLKLSMGEKLMFSLGKVCNTLGLKAIGKSCMNRIKTENLQKITNREHILADSIDIVSHLREQPAVVSKVAQNLIAARAANRKGREM